MPNGSGALLIDGKWGAGKTYFIRNDLKPHFENREENIKHNKCFFLIVSLFGVTTAEEFDKAIKREYLLSKTVGGKRTYKIANGFKTVLSSLPKIGNIVQGVSSSVNIYDLVTIPDEAIIVLDDLERCSGDYYEILGLINDLSENRNVKVIVVANADKIPEGKLEVYRNFKEKVFVRSLHFSPDAESIVDALLERYVNSDNDYFIEIKKHKLLLVSSLVDNKKCDGNIRTLKRVIDDFKWIWDVIRGIAPNTVDYSAYDKFIETKLNRFVEDVCYSKSAEVVDYGKPVSDEEISVDSGKGASSKHDTEVQSISKITSKWALESKRAKTPLRDWLIEGVWDAEAIEALLKESIACYRTSTPKDIILRSRPFEIEDSILQEGWSECITAAKNGTLPSAYDTIKIVRFNSLYKYNSISVEGKLDYAEIEKVILSISDTNWFQGLQGYLFPGEGDDGKLGRLAQKRHRELLLADDRERLIAAMKADPLNFEIVQSRESQEYYCNNWVTDLLNEEFAEAFSELWLTSIVKVKQVLYSRFDDKYFNGGFTDFSDEIKAIIKRKIPVLDNGTIEDYWNRKLHETLSPKQETIVE
jgi:hypothetical protein